MDNYVGILSRSMEQLDLLANNPGAEESDGDVVHPALSEDAVLVVLGVHRI